MELVPIPKDKYDEYRLTLMFDCYKWDPQFLDSNTIAKYALVITQEEHEELVRLTEKLDEETRTAEEFLNNHLELAMPLELTGKLKGEIRNMKNYEADKNIRLMRYDFHPTMEGKWAVSEVNSDVPGGFAEASLMPAAAIQLLENDNYRYKNFGDILVKAISAKVPDKGRIMLVHCTCYSDDRQVMQFLGDRLKSEGFRVVYGAADHLRFKDNVTYSILDDNEGRIDAIIRFTPLEWLTEIKPKHWQGYFDTTTLSCNHPVAIFAQTKRFPLVWDLLEQNGISMCTWRKLLPDTLEVKDAKGKEGYIYKPAYGRVGEKISIKEACKDDEYKKIIAEVKMHPKKYLAQKQFISKPLEGENGETYHVCLGSYTVDGEHAGYYARISETLRIDSNAADIPVLICRDDKMDEFNKEECLYDLNKSKKVIIKAKEKKVISEAEGKEVISEEENKVIFETKKSTLEMNGKEVFKIWAPSGKKWVDWVRPVSFVGISEHSKMYNFSNLDLQKVDFLKGKYYAENRKNTAVIVDLPGVESVSEGIALAEAGFRPVPIFNGTIEQPGARATVDNQSVGTALMWGASKLCNIEISDDAMPAFLVDRNRLHRFKMEESIFDNSWDVYPQDLPSAEYFLSSGIDKIVVIGESLSKDLKKMLYEFQKKKIQIFLTNGYNEPEKHIVHRTLLNDK